MLLIFASGCVTNKHKIKDKQELNTELQTKSTSLNNENTSVDRKETKKDSSSTNQRFSLERNQLFASQNFQLKNNGKCAEPGTLRNVEFTDVLGNKTSIPVNDNTELHFKNDIDFKKEVESLKIENKQLSETVNEIQSKYEKQLSVNQDLKQRINFKSNNTDTKTESSTIWQFVLCAILTVIIWEGSKKLIKTYIL